MQIFNDLFFYILTDYKDKRKWRVVLNVTGVNRTKQYLEIALLSFMGTNYVDEKLWKRK